MKKIFFLIFLFLHTLAFAQVVEIKKIKQIAPHLKKYHLIIFDLDNTIMEPAQLLGSDQWFFHRMQKHESDGFDIKKALDKTLLEWYEIQAITKVKLVEKDVKKIIRHLQNKNVLVMGLTTRDLHFSYSAMKQLDSLDIDLSKTAPYKENLYFDNGVLFNKGILFASGKNKGDVLKQFLNKIEFLPKSVIFIDDKLKHINEVDKFCREKEIKFLGFRYGALDEKIKNFDSQVANIQHKYFQSILSDEDAKRMLIK